MPQNEYSFPFSLSVGLLPGYDFLSNMPCAAKLSRLASLALVPGTWALFLQIPVGWQSGFPADIFWVNTANDIPFNLQVVNTDKSHDTFSLVSKVSPTADFAFFTLPIVPQGTYILRALNATNTSIVLDETPSFDIQGPPSFSFSSTSSSSTTTHSSVTLDRTDITSSSDSSAAPSSDNPTSISTLSLNQILQTTSLNVAETWTSASTPIAGKPGLSTGAIAGVGAGSGAAVVVLALISFLFIKRRGRKELLPPRVNPFEGTLCLVEFKPHSVSER